MIKKYDTFEEFMLIFSHIHHLNKECVEEIEYWTRKNVDTEIKKWAKISTYLEDELHILSSYHPSFKNEYEVDWKDLTKDIKIFEYRFEQS